MLNHLDLTRLESFLFYFHLAKPNGQSKHNYQLRVQMFFHHLSVLLEHNLIPDELLIPQKFLKSV